MTEKKKNKKIDLSVFVTSYNEEDLIVVTLTSLLKVLNSFEYSYEILIYDDASKDNSVSVIRNFIAKNKLEDRVELICNPTNQGIGVNYFAAAERSRGEYFFITHGDNAVRQDAMLAVLNLFGKADIVLTYYNTKLFSRRHNFDHRTFTRRLLSILYVKIVRLISGHEMRYFNGLVLHRRDYVLKYRVNAYGLGYQAELLCRMLARPSISFLEVRVHNYDRTTGFTTAFKLKNIFSVGISLTRIFRRRIAEIL